MTEDRSLPDWTVDTVRSEWPGLLRRLARYPELLEMAQSAQVVAVDEGEAPIIWLEATPEVAVKLNDGGQPHNRILEEELAATLKMATGDTMLRSFRLKAKTG